MSNFKNFVVIGVSGYARAGKDMFCKIASSILTEQGYTVNKLAFADELKKLADPICQKLFGISAFTDDTEEKKIIRPGLVWIGCGLRENKGPNIWVDKVNHILCNEANEYSNRGNKDEKRVYFISDVRFPNEVNWVHDWNGWVLHLSKFRHGSTGEQIFDEAPNAEEAKNDPLIKEIADYRLSWEDVRTTDPNIKISEIANDNYLINTVRLCLSKCPLLNNSSI